MSGVRGIAGSEVGADTVMRYCASFAAATEGGGACAVARDTRPSGAALYDAAVSALLASGADVRGLGVAPTPVAFYEARKAGRGMVVTASHNPLEWNGLKFAVGGRGANASEMAGIAGGANARGWRGGGSGGGGGGGSGSGGRAEAPGPPPAIGALEEAKSDYTEAALEVVRRAAGGGGGGPPRVVVDAGGGAAAGVAPDLLDRIGCGVEVVNAEPGRSDRGPDPTSERLASLEAACAAGGRAGFAFDLDGDRVVVVAPGGGGGRPRALSPDATLCLGVKAALEAGCRRFVLSIDTSAAAESLVRNAGGRVWRSRVGEANVVEEMDARGAEAGGEGSSAGFILRSFNGCRDGMLAAGMIAASIGGGEAVAGAAAEAMAGYSQARAKVPADSALHARTLELADERIGGRFSESSSIDGVKWIGEGHWVLARGSNTEDAVRVSAEARGEEEARALLRDAAGAVAESYEIARRGGDR